MSILKRTCATCASFNPSATQDEEPCGNLVFFTEHHGTPQAVSRAPRPTDWCDSHRTHKEEDDESREIDMERHLKEATPEFLTAMDACLALVETLGENHPDTIKAMRRAMLLSPPSLNALMADKAREMGMMPDADGYLDDGAPVFTLESVAARLGISMEDAQEAMDAMLADSAALGLPTEQVDPATVHRKH